MTALQAANGNKALSTELQARIDKIKEKAAANKAASKASSTKRAYDSDWNIFNAWCNELGQQSLPAQPEIVVAFLAEQSDQFAAPTLTRRLAAIRYYHLDNGHESPTSHPEVKVQIAGIRNEQANPDSDDYRQSGKKKAATSKKINKMIALCDNTLKGKRDRALLTIGFMGAFRRSELAALQVSDIDFKDNGIDVLIRKSKTDQVGKGSTIWIPDGEGMEAVKVLRDWLDSADITEGYLFRGFYRGAKSIRNTELSGRAIADLVKSYAAKAGYDETDFAAHSLRSGFITSSANNNASINKIKEVSRHKSTQVLVDYIEESDKRNNPAGGSFA